MFTQPCFSCGILYLVSQLINKKKSIQALVLKSTTISGLEDDDDEERYNDVRDETTVNVNEEEEIKEEPEDVEVKEEVVDDDVVLIICLCILFIEIMLYFVFRMGKMRLG